MIVILLALVALTNAQFLLHRDSCKNRCFTPNDFIQDCQCGSDCETYGSCCDDFLRLCRGPEKGLVVTQSELDQFAQKIWNKDTNRVDQSLLKLQKQGLTNNSIELDLAPNPLMVAKDDQLAAILKSPSQTYATFIKLLNNTEINENNAESRPIDEIVEENNFIAKAAPTTVMQLTFEFLRDNGFIRGDKDAFGVVMNELWFRWYDQHNGFETVMVGEKVAGPISNQINTTNHIRGLSNWVQFYLEEKAGRLNYLGYTHSVQDPPVMTVRYRWHKSLGKSTFFVGTSPEFDMALYTVCALARSSKPCDFTINGYKLSASVLTGSYGYVKYIKDVNLHVNQ